MCVQLIAGLYPMLCVCAVDSRVVCNVCVCVCVCVCAVDSRAVSNVVCVKLIAGLYPMLCVCS